MKDLSSHPFYCSIRLNWNEGHEFGFLSFWPFFFVDWNWNPNPCQCCCPIALLGIFFRWRHRMKAKSTNRLYHNFNMCSVHCFYVFFTIACKCVCVCKSRAETIRRLHISSIEWNMKPKRKTLALQLCLKITYFNRIWNWQL